MTTHLDHFSQTETALILPTEPNESVQFNISAIPNFDKENFGYEQLAVFVNNERDEYSSNEVQGRYKIEGDYLMFSPFYPFDQGMTYTVRSKHLDNDSDYSYQSFLLEKNHLVEEAKVLQVYPTANLLPENMLRFYIYFNTPMQKGQALNYIQLIDADGNIDAQAFMEFKQELWSSDGKRLTILFDPGRIKRGVSTNMALGPALIEGNQFYLTISTAWQDVYGQPLSEKTCKEFAVVKAYRDHLKVNGLAINKPKPNSSEPLGIHFDRVMDHALIQSMIQIEDEERKFLAGHWVTLEQEHLIQFMPENSWLKGIYRIVIDSRLEDVAGNNLHSLLDTFDSDKESKFDTYQSIEFEL